MSDRIRVLIAVEHPADADLCIREIKKVLDSCEFKRVKTRKNYISELKKFNPAFVISDYKMPRFSGIIALKLARQHDPEMPFIIVNGSASEQTAVKFIKAGAWDYVIKGHIKRLGPAVLAALEEKRLRKEKKKSENALEQSEERYRILFENTAQAIAVVKKGKVIFGNPKLEETTGFTVSELAGMDAFGLIHPDDLEMILDYSLRRQRGEPVPSHYQFRFFNRAGELKWAERRISDIIWEGEKAALVIDTDITENKKVEETTRESEEKYRSLNINMAEGVALHEIIYDNSGEAVDYRILDVNPAYSIITGILKEKALGAKASQLYGTGDAPYLDIYKQVASSGKSTAFEIYFPPLARHFNISIFSTSKGRFATIFTDITERKAAEEKLKESEEQLKTALENAPDGVYMNDLEGHFLYSNRKCDEIIGYDHEELIGKNFLELNILSEEGIAKAIEILKENRQGKSTGPDEFDLIRKDGNRIPVEINTSVFKRLGQTVVLGFVRDITKRKEMDKALKISETKYRVLFESLPFGVTVSDKDGNITESNKEAERLLGLSAEEQTKRQIVGKEWQIIRPDGSPLPSDEYASVRALRENRLIENVEMGIVKSGDEVTWINVTAAPIPLPEYGVAIAYSDISQRKKAENDLNDSVRRFNQVAEVAEEFIWETDEQGMYRYCSPAVEKILGYTADELVGLKHFYDLFTPEIRDEFKGLALSAFEHRQSIRNLVNPNIHKNGSRIYLETNGLPIIGEKGNLLGYRGVDKDITERVRAEQELNAREFRFRELVQNMSSGVVVYEAVAGGEDFIIKDFNRAAEKIEKIKKEDLIGKRVLTVFPGVKEFGIFDVFQRVWRSGKAEHFPVAQYQDERISGWRENYIYRLPSGEIVAVYDDVTEKKLAEEAMAMEATRRRILIEQSRDGIVILDKDGTVYEANQRFADMLGYSLEEARLLHVWDWEYLYSPEQTTDMIRNVDEKGDHFETKHRRKDGTVYDVEISTNAALFGREKLIFCVCRDITQRKKDAEQIARSKALLQTVIDSTPDRISVKDRSHRYLLVNKSLSDFLNCRPQEMIGKLDSDYFTREQLEGNPEKGIRSVRADEEAAFAGQVVHGISNTGDKFGNKYIFDSFRVPLRDSGDNIYGVLVYNRDITELYTATENLKQSYHRVQIVLEQTVEAIASICETRDPYTAGHQDRVAQLATAIAAEMGIKEDDLASLKTAAILHDVGKLFVPAEILSKPGKLTEIEFNIIKVHPQAGYEIVRKIDFPSVVSAVVLQHHERLNGSGYPEGLTGADITMEAKIVAVADVTEAMSSHRPYRAAVGIHEALDEINKNKGTLYDEKAVDICTRLFNEKQFKFE